MKFNIGILKFQKLNHNFNIYQVKKFNLFSLQYHSNYIFLLKIITNIVILYHFYY